MLRSSYTGKRLRQHTATAHFEAVFGTTFCQAIRTLKSRTQFILSAQALTCFDFRPVAGHDGFILEFLERRLVDAAEKANKEQQTNLFHARI